MYLKRNLGRLAPIISDDMAVVGGSVLTDTGISTSFVKPIVSAPVAVVTQPVTVAPTSPAPSPTPSGFASVISQVVNAAKAPIDDSSLVPTGPGIVQGSPKIQANVGTSSSPSATVSTLTSGAPASLSSDAQSLIDNTKNNLVQATQNIDPKKAIMIVGGVVLVSGILYAATRKKKTTT